MAFQKIKKHLLENTSRAQPNFEKEFVLITDASEHGIGAILSQTDEEGSERMIVSFSKGLYKHQKNYSTTDKELLAVVKGIKHFRHYLLGSEFTLKTDHKALTYLWECKDPTTRLLRWAMKLQEYKFKIIYIKGEDNVADGYSRIHNMTWESTKTEPRDEEKSKILEEYHLRLGHPLSNVLIEAINKRYKWQNMYKDINGWCKNCTICKKFGGPEINTKNKIIETIKENELWEIDLVGRLDDKVTNKFIFVGIDHYSKWIETKIIKTKTANEIIQTIDS